MTEVAWAAARRRGVGGDDQLDRPVDQFSRQDRQALGVALDGAILDHEMLPRRGPTLPLGVAEFPHRLTERLNPRDGGLSLQEANAAGSGRPLAGEGHDPAPGEQARGSERQAALQEATPG